MSYKDFYYQATQATKFYTRKPKTFMELVITNAIKACKMVQKKPNYYRVVSISSPDRVVQIEGAKEILYQKYNDVTMQLTSSDILVTEDHCIEALDFISQGGPCLVHCAAGVSRSTATVLGYLLKTLPSYQEAVEELYRIRPCASPNSLVLKKMCKILALEEHFSEIFNYTQKLSHENRKTASLDNIPYTEWVEFWKKFKF